MRREIKELQKIDGPYGPTAPHERANGRRCRFDPSLNLWELSEITGVEYTHLSKILNGRLSPVMSTAVNVATALGLPVEEMYVRIGQVKVEREMKERTIKELRAARRMKACKPVVVVVGG